MMNFFATGNDIFAAGLDLNFITPVGSRSANFASRSQTLRESFSIANNVFRLMGRDKINFVLIGLAPDILFRDADNNLTADAFDDNLQTLDAYIQLCAANGAKPVGVILPCAPSVREHYGKQFVTPLKNILTEFERLYPFHVVNLFDYNFAEELFFDDMRLIPNGAELISSILMVNLYIFEFFTEEELRRLNYLYFNVLSFAMDKNFFNGLMKKIFAGTVAELRRKEKIRLAFVTDHAAVWCGDELYNRFAENPRFKTTVFLCRGTESTEQDFQHDLAQFQAAGINVVGISDLRTQTPPQDVIIFLRPYIDNLSANFQPEVLTPQTLIACINYSYQLLIPHGIYDLLVYKLAWKFFFDTEPTRKLFDDNCNVGIPRGVASGLPKMDFFADTSRATFPWKMTRPDAKKIIWAPHHSFERDADHRYATFQWNYQFMYEFAKAHPETSWVVKPHPRLAFTAVETGLFPSGEAYEDYMRAWDALPNAQVYTGAYYQDIFATSDGMIHDSGSFIAEYQFTGKPMIYLLSAGPTDYTELGEKILSVSYCVDGKNFDDISAAIQKIFIEGNDPLKAERQKIFDELLNYRRFNGMSATDFIYKTITDELH